MYSDEDKIDENSNRYDAYFKPDFAIDTLRAQNYICHFSVFKKELMERLGGFRSEYDGAQDYDIFLRMAETVDPKNIKHIPKFSFKNLYLILLSDSTYFLYTGFSLSEPSARQSSQSW